MAANVTRKDGRKTTLDGFEVENVVSYRECNSIQLKGLTLEKRTDFRNGVSLFLATVNEDKVRVRFEEDQEERDIPRSKRWKLRSTSDEDSDFDSLKVGVSVLAYWSPMRTFYDATVIRVSSSKYAASSHSISSN